MFYDALDGQARVLGGGFIANAVAAHATSADTAAHAVAAARG